jgi:hypothetical protein
MEIQKKIYFATTSFTKSSKSTLASIMIYRVQQSICINKEVRKIIFSNLTIFVIN